MRKHDHLVEPLFGALRHHGEPAEAGGAPPRRRRARLAGLLAGALALAAVLAWLA